MWLPQGGALKIENLQFTQYSIILNMLSVTALLTTNLAKPHINI